MQRNQHSGANPVDEVIIELLRQGPCRKAELEERIPASNVYHRCLQLMASGRIVASHRSNHMETIYNLSDSEKEKGADVSASAKQTSHNEAHNVLK